MKLSKLKILITGGAGFIGSHLSDVLLELKNEVRVLDNFDSFYDPEEKKRNINHNLKNHNYKIIQGDLLHYPTLKNAMNGVDLVIHEAAQAGVRYCIKYPDKAHSTNVTGTFYVLKAAKELGIKKVIYPSSSSVFGIPKYLPFDEEHPTNPTSPYAASKLAAEKYCQVFHEVYGLNVVTLRYFSVYGPRMRPDLAIREFTKRILEGENPLMIFGGNQSRDWTFISDIVNATLLAAEMEESGGEVFNIGYGGRTKLRELLKLIIEILGKEGKVTIGQKDIYKGDFPHTYADISKAQKILGYKPQIPLKKGLTKFINWYKEIVMYSR